MNVEFLRQFQKDLTKLKNKTIFQKIINIIEHIKTAKNIEEISNLKKLKGFEDAYRIRIGDYRMGVFIGDNMVTFARFLHRKDIYKYFP